MLAFSSCEDCSLLVNTAIHSLRTGCQNNKHRPPNTRPTRPSLGSSTPARKDSPKPLRSAAARAMVGASGSLKRLLRIECAPSFYFPDRSGQPLLSRPFLYPNEMTDDAHPTMHRPPKHQGIFEAGHGLQNCKKKSGTPLAFSATARYSRCIRLLEATTLFIICVTSFYFPDRSGQPLLLRPFFYTQNEMTHDA